MNFTKILPWLRLVLYLSMCLHTACGNDFNLALNGGDDPSVINPAYYQFAHSHGSEEELLDMDWNTHFLHHEKGIAHTHMDHLFGSSQKSNDNLDHGDINSDVLHQVDDHEPKLMNIPGQSMSLNQVSGSINSKPVIPPHEASNTQMHTIKHSHPIVHEKQNAPSVQPEVINMEYYQFGHKHNVLEYDMNMNKHSHVHHNGMNVDFAHGQQQSSSSDRVDSLGSTMPKLKNSVKYESTAVEMDMKHSQDYKSKGYYSNQNQDKYHAKNTKYQFSSELNDRPKQDMDNYNQVTKNQYTSSKNSIMLSHDQLRTSHGSGDSQISDTYPKGYDHGSSDKGVHTTPYADYENPQLSEQKHIVGENTEAVDTQVYVVGSGISYVPVEHIQVSQAGLKRNVAPSYGDSRRIALNQMPANYDTQSDYYHQMDMESI